MTIPSKVPAPDAPITMVLAAKLCCAGNDLMRGVAHSRMRGGAHAGSIDRAQSLG